MTAYGYLRRSSVSAERPGEASREVQETEVRALARRHGDDPTILVDWGISGRRGADKRPGYRRLLEAIEAGHATAVYSYSLSRLGRSLPELSRLIEDCERRGVPVRLVADSLDTSTASGRLLANVLGSVAAFEADVARERVMASQAARVARGERLGPRFYDDPDVVLAAFDEAGSFAGAAKLLNARGVKSRSGRPWWPSSVDCIVRRERPYIPNPGRGRRTVGAFRLARLLVCGTCGTHLTGSTDRETTLIRYQCRKASVLPHAKVSITEGRILPAIKAEVAHLVTPDQVVMGEGAEGRAQRLDDERARVLDLYQSGDIDRPEKVRRLAGIAERMAAIEAQRVVLAVPSVDWSWEPTVLNNVLRAMFVSIELDPETFQPKPDGFTWTVPEWRA